MDADLKQHKRGEEISRPLLQGNPGEQFPRARFLRLPHILGLLALGAAVVLFALIAEDVATTDPLTLTDVQISNWLHAHTTPRLTTFFLLISQLHSSLI